MKTAKEILNEVTTEGIEAFGETRYWKESEVLLAMKVFARYACKDQREICGRKAFETGIGVSHSKDILHRIKTAPEPELK